MTIALYDISVATYLQHLAAMTGVLERGLDYCRAENIDPQEVVETRIHPDMRPFSFQLRSTVHHSLGAVEALRTGQFGPPGEAPKPGYTDLLERVAEARATLAAVTQAEINALEGGEVVFEMRGNRRIFTAPGFILSFSLPNFFFHATTAYDILRARGVPIGKRDFMGVLRLKS